MTFGSKNSHYEKRCNLIRSWALHHVHLYIVIFSIYGNTQLKNLQILDTQLACNNSSESHVTLRQTLFASAVFSFLFITEKKMEFRFSSLTVQSECFLIKNEMAFNIPNGDETRKSRINFINFIEMRVAPTPQLSFAFNFYNNNNIQGHRCSSHQIIISIFVFPIVEFECLCSYFFHFIANNFARISIYMKAIQP